MKGLQSILAFIGVTTFITPAIEYLKNISYFFKTDEEIISSFLKSEKDKAEFQKTIDDMLKNNEKSRTIKINNKDITITI